MSKNKINTLTGTSIVVANMIGAGVFTSLGFQLISLHNTATILTLWLCGDVIALSGAFSYVEIGTLIKKSRKRRIIAKFSFYAICKNK